MKELLLVLDSESNSEIIAGGTDLVIIMEELGERPEKLIDITNIKALTGIKEEISKILQKLDTPISI